MFPAESFDGKGHRGGVPASTPPRCTRSVHRGSPVAPSSCEWLRTNKYDKNNKRHVDVVDGIAEGNALGAPSRLHCRHELSEVQCTFTPDDGRQAWQAAMKSARRAAYITHILTVFSSSSAAPMGTARHMMLLKAAATARGGDLGIFSPMYLIVAKKSAARRRRPRARTAGLAARDERGYSLQRRARGARRV